MSTPSDHQGNGPFFCVELSETVFTITLERDAGPLSWQEIEEEANDIIDLLEHTPGLTVLLDLGKLDSCGSSVLAIILRIGKWVQLHGGRWALCNIHSGVANVLQRTRLDMIWPIYASREEAYSALQAGG
ncbi:MAG: STAS domain-containing protein [Planctomycetes bacterium]|nr:STAS domain-containing protein [Planctomycetota bacterium]